MKLARSTYYYRSRRAAAAKIIVRDRIVALCDEFPRYGYRRVTAQLKAEGTTINHKTVSRIMRDNGLQVRPLRRFVRTTDSDHNGPIFPNLVREFVPASPINFGLPISVTSPLPKGSSISQRYLMRGRAGSSATRSPAVLIHDWRWQR